MDGGSSHTLVASVLGAVGAPSFPLLLLGCVISGFAPGDIIAASLIVLFFQMLSVGFQGGEGACQYLLTLAKNKVLIFDTLTSLFPAALFRKTRDTVTDVM